MLGIASTAVRTALAAIQRNRVRSALTVLGVLIGVASVVLVTALAGGARAEVADQLSDFGSDVIFVGPISTPQLGARARAVGHLTEGDGRAIAREATTVSRVGLWLGAQGHVVRGDKNVATSLDGANLDFLAIRKWTVERGQAWEPSDEIVRSRVCLLGAKVRDKLFSREEDPVGQIVRIGTFPFRVAGVLKARGESSYGEDLDDRVIMPLGSLRARFVHGVPGQVDRIFAAASSRARSPRAARDIAAILRQRHGIADPNDGDFTIKSESELSDTIGRILRTMSVLFLGVAAISLLVGGVGVMNIMLVSVTERTREIGVRLSIGARRRDVLLQFVVEAMVMTLIGGLAGTSIGVALTLVVGYAVNRPLHPDLASIAAAVLTSGGIGLLFGYLPARRAARLDPIDALRADG